MKVADAIRGVTRLFLDSAPVIYYAERHPQFFSLVRPFFQSIDAGNIAAVTSPVTLAECLVLPYRQGLVGQQRLFKSIILDGTNTRFVLLDQAEGDKAAELRARYNLS